MFILFHIFQLYIYIIISGFIKFIIYVYKCIKCYTWVLVSILFIVQKLSNCTFQTLLTNLLMLKCIINSKDKIIKKTLNNNNELIWSYKNNGSLWKIQLLV
jgi:hypothetical protein